MVSRAAVTQVVAAVVAAQAELRALRALSSWKGVAVGCD
jgi:hypothetical protein